MRIFAISDLHLSFSTDKLDTFDETIFKSLVREIKVTAPKEIEISYNCGLTIKEQIK